MFDNLSIIIYAHSDYEYLSKIIEERLYFFKKINKIFCHDILYKNLPLGFDKYILYNDKINYSKRWLDILKNNSLNNILIIHDVNIILNFDISVFNIYYSLFTENKIDRLSFSIFYSNDNLTKFVDGNDYKICNLNNVIRSNHFTPYDVCPSLWKKESFLNLFNLFNNESYASSEMNINLQKYCREKLKCYGISYTPIIKIQYCRGLVFSSYFKFLHITTGGKLLLPYEIYMDTKDDLISLIQKYNLNLNTEVNNDVLKNFKPII